MIAVLRINESKMSAVYTAYRSFAIAQSIHNAMQLSPLNVHSTPDKVAFDGLVKDAALIENGNRVR